MSEDGVMEDHVSYMESELTRFQIMGTNFDAPVKVTPLMYSLPNLSEYETITTSIKALQEETATWDYVSTLLVEESRKIAHRRINEPIRAYNSVGTVAVSSNAIGKKTNPFQSSVRRTRMRCFACGKRDDVAKRCRIFQMKHCRQGGKQVDRTRQDKFGNNRRKVMSRSTKHDNSRKSTLLEKQRFKDALVTVDCGATKDAVNDLMYF